MRALRVTIAFIGGIWLYYFTVVYFGGILAAIAVPRGYFAFFGREHNELALALLSIFGWAAPVGLLVTSGLLAIHRLLTVTAESVWKAALSGMAISFLYWAMVSVGSVSLQDPQQASVLQAIWTTFTLPWWAVPNFVAPWVGVALAVWLTIRGQRAASPGEA
jgi:hypothetical protein